MTAEHIKIDTHTQDILFRAARTANTFTDEPVTDAEVEAIYELTKWGPTAMNSQPLRVILVRTPEAKERLISHLGVSNRAKTESAPLAAILATDTNFHDRLSEVFPHFPGARDMYSANDERRIQVAKEQAWLQAGYFILGIRAAGLAAGPMTGYDAAGVDADLLAGTSLRSIAVMNIGHPGPESWRDRLPRLAHKDVVTVL